MLKFTLGRIAQAVVTLLGIAIVGFLLTRLIPGNPGRIELGQFATPAAVRAFNARLHLNEPLGTAFINYLSHAVRLQFGQSFSESGSVASVIGQHAGPTAVLFGYGTLLAIVIAIPIGLYVAVREGKVADHLTRVVGVVLFAMPPFSLALVLALIFGLELRLLPVVGYESGLVGTLRYLTLPAVALALGAAPWFIRTLRASVIDTLSSGYVEAARARGFSERRVMYRQVLRNSLIPFVTLVAVLVGQLLSLAVIYEAVFGIPGLGSLLVSAVQHRDFALVQGLTVVFGAVVVGFNLVADLVCAAIDPRVRL